MQDHHVSYPAPHRHEPHTKPHLRETPPVIGSGYPELHGTCFLSVPESPIRDVRYSSSDRFRANADNPNGHLYNPVATYKYTPSSTAPPYSSYLHPSLGNSPHKPCPAYPVPDKWQHDSTK